MKRLLWIAGALGLLLTACASATLTASPPAERAPQQEDQTVPAALPDGPLAPELTNDTWLNTEALTAADLRGKVVLIDFWTFG